MVNDKRNLGMYILLNFVTCGIYSFFFLYELIKDMNKVCEGDGEETQGLLMFILLSIITCGIYSWYWYYKLGNRQAANGARYNINISENGTTILVWMLIGGLIAGLGYWVAMYMIIKNMNALAYAYNNKMNNGSGYPNYPNQNILPNQNGYSGQQSTSAATERMEKSALLRCTAGEFCGCEFPVEQNDMILIGRDLSCNIKLDEDTPNVSRRHCTVTVQNGNVYVTDNNSSFGTYLDNGTKLPPNQKTLIRPGTGFYLGNRNICFVVG